MASDLPVQTNLLAHYRADLLSLSDTNPVSSWPSETTSGYNADQATAGNRPVYRTNQVNGLPAVVFDGTDDWLQSTTSVALKPCTLLAYVQYTVASPTVEATILGSSAGGGLQWRVATDYDVELMESGIQRIGTSTDAGQRIVASAWAQISVTYSATGAFEFRKNNNVSGSGTFDTTINSGTLQIGRYGSGGVGAEHWTGAIAELAVFSSVLSSTDLSSNNNFMAGKYSGTVISRTVSRVLSTHVEA